MKLSRDTVRHTRAGVVNGRETYTTIYEVTVTTFREGTTLEEVASYARKHGEGVITLPSGETLRSSTVPSPRYYDLSREMMRLKDKGEDYSMILDQFLDLTEGWGKVESQETFPKY